MRAKHNVQYVELDDLFQQSDVISLHTPLTKETRHLVNKQSINKMKNVIQSSDDKIE